MGGGVFDAVSAEFVQFWTERRICLLTTPGKDGTPHVVAVGVTVDVEHGLARVICRGTSQKAVNAARNGDAGVRAAVSAVDGRLWSTLQGTAVVRADAEPVAEAERRYAERYRVPTPNPERVVIEIAVDKLLGSVR